FLHRLLIKLEPLPATGWRRPISPPLPWTGFAVALTPSQGVISIWHRFSPSDIPQGNRWQDGFPPPSRVQKSAAGCSIREAVPVSSSVPPPLPSRRTDRARLGNGASARPPPRIALYLVRSCSRSRSRLGTYTGTACDSTWSFFHSLTTRQAHAEYPGHRR